MERGGERERASVRMRAERADNGGEEGKHCAIGDRGSGEDGDV